MRHIVTALRKLLKSLVGITDDPFYALNQLADSHGKSLTNRQMDKLIYGP